jgi:formate/nitrite transporter FocA (FNT family)
MAKSAVSHKKSAGSTAPKVTATDILKNEVEEGLDALERSNSQLFVSALSGGLDVGFSLFLMAVVTSLAGDQLSAPIVRMLVANMYSVGFIFVILGRSELFTEQTTLAVLPVLRGKAKISELLRLWGIVYVANLIGAAIIALMISKIGPALHVITPASLGDISHRMVDHSGGVMLCSAILAGWLMGLVSWMVAAGRDTISQIVIVWIVTAAIGIGGLHHSILGSVEVLAGLFAGQGITAFDFLHFLIWSTLGNVLGGSVFVSIIKFGHARPE